MNAIRRGLGTSPLGLKLLTPVALGCVAMVAAVSSSIDRLGGELAMDRLRQRAEIVARTVTYAAETVRSETDFQRLVSSIGSEEGVTVIVAIGGDPLHVVASTKHAWLGRSLESIPIEDYGEDLREAIRTGRQHFHHHRESHEVDCSIPMAADHTDSILRGGAVMVHIDARPVERAVARLTQLIFLSGLILALT
ncbi:MAG: hypothetical protein KDA28_04825, partial [Phycisphaerales bacterium]|nr:hypothetical protein [Phycisphaerales bacterium]